MDIGRAVQYWMSDTDWIKKILIGGVLFLVPIIGWLIIGGYFIRNVQSISRGSDTPLPEWNQWGDDLVRGLKFAAVMIVWTLPLWVISICVFVIGVADEGAGSAAGLLLNCLSFLYSLAFYFIFPVIVGRFAQAEDIGAAFQISGIIQDAQKIPSQLLIFLVMYFVVSLVASLGIIICFVGVLFTGFIAYLIYAHLIAQISGMLGHSGPVASAPPPTM
ncbi:MAG: DUF4013 domain-containing protein [Thermomicrobiaceae bacterium]